MFSKVKILSFFNQNHFSSRLYPLPILILMAACGGSHAPPLSPQQVEKAPVLNRNSEGWIVEHSRSSESGITVERVKMPPEQIQRVQAELRQTNLVAIPIDPKYNVSLFKIRNVPEWTDTVFIAPKLFAYGSAERARIAPKINPDGTATLSFPVLLTDATQPVVASADAATKVSLPDALLVNDLSGLRSELNRRFGTAQTLSILPGCPKKIIVKVNDSEYDATPSDLARGDFCQGNAAFSADLKLPVEHARYVLQRALYAHAVDVRAVYETRVSFPVSRVTLKFDKAKLFEDIEAEMSMDGGFWADVDVHSKVTKIVKKQTMSVNIQGQTSALTESIVSQAMGEFFDKLSPDPKTESKGCGSARVCLRLNYNYSKRTQSFEASWDESTNTLTGQNYIAWTKLKALTDRVVDIGNATSRPTLRNGGSTLETGLTALDGDLLEITPSYLIKEEREDLNAVPVTTDDFHCFFNCDKEGANCSGRHGFLPMSCALPRHIIDRKENHWIKTTRYDLAAPKLKRFDQPIGQLEQIFDGMALKFTWKEKGEERSLTCSLKSFARDGDGSSLLLRLENRPGCEPFRSGADGAPMLHLVNKISFPMQYNLGTTVEYWDGRFQDNRVLETYYPRVDFAGTVAIRGYDLESVSAGGRLERR